MNATEAKKQREQLARYTEWVKEEGNLELPTNLDTIMKPHQVARVKWLKSYSTGRIMELGCCWGYILAYIGGHIGVDWNEHSIELARLLNPDKEFIVADIRDLPFGDNFVDTIIIPEVLEHLAWGEVFGVIDRSRQIARQRVLITLPYEMADIEAGCFKHQWLVTPRKIVEIQKRYRDTIFRLDKRQGFVFIGLRCGE
jgi:SAM-dependent methyltransferase